MLRENLQNICSLLIEYDNFHESKKVADSEPLCQETMMGVYLLPLVYFYTLKQLQGGNCSNINKVYKLSADGLEKKNSTCSNCNVWARVNLK